MYLPPPPPNFSRAVALLSLSAAVLIAGCQPDRVLNSAEGYNLTSQTDDPREVRLRSAVAELTELSKAITAGGPPP